MPTGESASSMASFWNYFGCNDDCLRKHLINVFPVFFLFLFLCSSLRPPPLSSVHSRPKHYTGGPVPLSSGTWDPTGQTVRLRQRLSTRRWRRRPMPWVHSDTGAQLLIRELKRKAHMTAHLPAILDQNSQVCQPYWFVFNEAVASDPTGQ